MSEQPNVVEQKKGRGLMRMLPGLLISLLALSILLFFIDVEEFKNALGQVRASSFILVVLFFFGTLFSRAAAWRLILREQIGLKRSFFTINEGYLLNNVLPFRLGEVGRALLLRQTEGIPFWEVISTVMVERIFDVGIMASLLLGTIPFAFGAPQAEKFAYLAGAVVLIGFVTLFLIARNKLFVLNIFNRVAGRWQRLADFGLPKLEAFLDGLQVLTTFKRFSAVAVFMLLAWFFNIAWYAVLLRSFAPSVPLIGAVFVVSITAAGVAVPSSPGYVGVFEAAIVGALKILNVDPSTGLAFAVVSHAVYLTITLLLGGYALGQDGVSLGQLYRALRERQE